MDLPNTQTIVGRRDAVLLALMFSTGARAQEMCSLLVKDVCFHADGTASITLKGKGRSNRTVKICGHTTRLLVKYLNYQKRKNSPDSHAFVSQTHDYMTVSCVEAVFKKYVSHAKSAHPDLFQSDSYPPHSMRHTTAVAMIEAGVPLPIIQVTLGHKDLKTTQIYAEITQPSLDETLLKWNTEFWKGLSSDGQDKKEEEAMPEPADNPEFPGRKITRNSFGGNIFLG